ncbi:MAG: hypothetical protein HRF52_14430 [Ignavibacterium sp.]|jgi:hypothetical protein|uniref:RNA repair transcriptional activator RtcR family protein n=1 Tax=Ignavibacterium sp. TaxID=2651167 RepID=UPI00329A581A
MKKKEKILLSFIGSNDAGKLNDKPDGAILTALKNEEFDRVQLLWNKGKVGHISYQKISDYLMKEIRQRKLASKINSTEIPIEDVTDHNSIYKLLKSFTDSLDKSEKLTYTAAISSGTPAMQVCWILLAESGDFSESNPLRLIKIKDPKFGKSENIEVKIDTTLPRIVRLKEEVESLKKDLIPVAKISISKPDLTLGANAVPLSPIELSYYRYFAERVISGDGAEKFSGVKTSSVFLKRIIEIHKEFFPDLDANRMDLEKILEKDKGLYTYSFRANVSKVNKKIRGALSNESIIKTFEISKEGQRGARFYGINDHKI